MSEFSINGVAPHVPPQSSPAQSSPAESAGKAVSDRRQTRRSADRRQRRRSIIFADMDFTPLDGETLFRRVVEIADAGGPFTYLTTPNVDHLVRLSHEPHYRQVHDQAWARVNDSRVLEALAKVDGLPLPANAGSDLTARVLTQAIDPNEPIVIIGSSQAVVAALQSLLGLKDVRWHAPPMGLRHKPDAIAAAAQFCADNPARFCFICVGHPQQELVAMAIKARGDAKGLGLCVGASLEFFTGQRKRAPLWMQRARLEWLHRLLSEPKVLWRRYLVEGPEIFRLWWQWRRQGRNPPH
jgi:exopolysaccharide biosynthesis WecB/TagA/CpsF family protein